jgi:hypothetical protein
VDLFLPSVLEWKERGVTIRIETRYPEEAMARFRLQTNGPARFALRLESTPCSYAAVERTWSSGDSLVVRFPMDLLLVQLPGDPGSVTIPLDPTVVGDRRRVAVMLKWRPGHPTPRLFGCAIELPR